MNIYIFQNLILFLIFLLLFIYIKENYFNILINNRKILFQTYIRQQMFKIIIQIKTLNIIEFN